MAVDTRVAAPAQDMHAFLDAYEREYPREVVHIERPLDARWEITALAHHLEQDKRFPILVCHNVMVDGRRAEIPLVTMMMASRLRLARLLGSDVRNAGRVCYERVQARQEPVVIPRAEAPVKQVVETGADIDLAKYPAPQHHRTDPGRYVTQGLFLTFNRETGRDNSAMQRGWLSGRDEIRVHLGPNSHNFFNLRAYEAAGEDVPCAYWVGHHPLVLLGAEYHVGRDDSHYASAGGTVGAPLRLTPSETLGENFLVPADAELVIEGYVPRGQRKPEAPFGEYTRHIGPQRWNPVLKVTAITRRRNAYWDDVMVSHTHWISSLTHEGRIFQVVSDVVPGVKAVHVPMSGGGVAHVYIQMRKTVEGQGKVAGIAALTAAFASKHAFVFDEDVDIFDEKQVLLAIAMRFQADRGLTIMPGMTGSQLDPSSPDGLTTKAVFDCTKPVGKPFPDWSSLPREVLEKINHREIIGVDQLDEIPVEPWG